MSSTEPASGQTTADELAALRLTVQQQQRDIDALKRSIKRITSKV
ncbi:hypothetical protein ACVWY0_003056 [Arthrobacter sp. UYNi723]